MASDCCDQDCEPALSLDQAEDLAPVFKALSDPVRLRLLSLIATCADGEVCACDLTEPSARSQATVSHHLSVLVKAGLITREQRGKWAWFQIAPDRRHFVHSIIADQRAVSLG